LGYIIIRLEYIHGPEFCRLTNEQKLNPVIATALKFYVSAEFLLFIFYKKARGVNIFQSCNKSKEPG
jgi:hypothetical protein